MLPVSAPIQSIAGWLEPEFTVGLNGNPHSEVFGVNRCVGVRTQVVVLVDSAVEHGNADSISVVARIPDRGRVDRGWHYSRCDDGGPLVELTIYRDIFHVPIIVKGVQRGRRHKVQTRVDGGELRYHASPERGDFGSSI